jgi:hypothetical protein
MEIKRIDRGCQNHQNHQNKQKQAKPPKNTKTTKSNGNQRAWSGVFQGGIYQKPPKTPRQAKSTETIKTSKKPINGF